ALNKYVVAISIGAVFFGAGTYIGNGPNFMGKSIADHQKVHTPSFVGYVLKFSLPYMFPVLGIVWGIFFGPLTAMTAMRLIYNVLFTAFLALSAPFYLLKMWRRGNWRRGFAQRFARYDSKVKQSVTNRHVLWVHAVSVGEVNICTHLIRALEPRLPNAKII